MTHEIRLATPEDLSAVEAIVRHAYSPYVSRIGRKPGPMLDNYASLIHSGRVHVAVHDGTVQGILVLLRETDAMLLDADFFCGYRPLCKSFLTNIDV